MTTKYSSQVTTAILFGAVLFFTSYTKETPVSPKEVEAIAAQP